MIHNDFLRYHLLLRSAAEERHIRGIEECILLSAGESLAPLVGFGGSMLKRCRSTGCLFSCLGISSAARSDAAMINALFLKMSLVNAQRLGA